MPAYRPGGSGGTYKLTWTGGRVVQQIDDAVRDEMESIASDIRAELLTTLHRVTGDMAEKSFAEVQTRGSPPRRTLVIGSDSDHTLYHELGWHRGSGGFEGHPQIRQIADEWAGRIPPRLRAAFRRLS